MKRVLLLITFLPMYFFAASQNCNEVADSKIKIIQEASTNDAYQNVRAYDSLRKEMSSTFEILENCAAKNPSYEQRSKMKKVLLYLSIADLAGQVGKYADMLKHVESAERILPSPNSLSTSSLAAFTVNGANYTSDISSSYVPSLYYQIIERRVNYYYFGEGSNKKVVEWYERITAGAPSDFKYASLEALLYADALYKTGKTTPEYFPAMAKAISLLGIQWAKKEDHDSAMINNRSLAVNWLVRENNSYNKARLNTADPNGKFRLVAAHGLWDADERPLAKEYALAASQAGASDKTEGFWYLDVVAGNEEKHIVGALTILEKNVATLSDAEMDRLLPLAQKYNVTGLEEGIKSRLRKIAALRRRSTISLIPAIELVGLPCGHIPVSLNLRTGRVLQEFRFDYVWKATTRYRFGRIFDKGEKGNRYRFTGWDVGYTISGILGKDFRQGNKKKGRSAFFSPAIGLDLRYVNWNLDPMTTNVVDENDQIIESNVLINATTNRYEACLRTSFITMTRFVTIDYYLGLGIGYRTLTTAQGRDVEEEKFSDARLKSERWNKLYMPLRFGIKVGFNIL